MLSRFVEFPMRQTVEVRSEEVGPPGPDEIRCRATTSMISTGTEMFCLRGEFDPGTNWESWVQYPFRPGYSMAATVVDAGPNVQRFSPGDRVVAWVPHQQVFTVPADEAHPIPPAIGDDEAGWVPLVCTAAAASASSANSSRNSPPWSDPDGSLPSMLTPVDSKSLSPMAPRTASVSWPLMPSMPFA